MLRNDIGARYKPIKKVPYIGNTPRCIILRQKYAMFVLDQLQRGVRVINLDQTWINDANFTRRKWRMRGQVNSSNDCKVEPRIAMQMCIDTEGELYCSLA